jgi:hypothetical protein
LTWCGSFIRKKQVTNGKEEQELKAMRENLCKEYNVDVCETKQMSHWENVIAMKNCQQAINAVKSIKWRGETARVAGASSDAVVSFKVDY